MLGGKGLKPGCFLEVGEEIPIAELFGTFHGGIRDEDLGMKRRSFELFVHGEMEESPFGKSLNVPLVFRFGNADGFQGRREAKEKRLGVPVGGVHGDGFLEGVGGGDPLPFADSFAPFLRF